MNDKPQFAGAKTPATCAVTVSSGVITAIHVIDAPMYWYDGEWHPYPKTDPVTVKRASR